MIAAMKKNHLLWIVSTLAIIVAAIWLLAPSQGPISRTAYGRIRLGMSRDDVMAIMMVPPGNYATDFHTSVGEVSEGRSKAGVRLWWISDNAMIDVEFDEREEVCWKDLHVIETERSIQQKLRLFWSSIKSWF
jgi:hypothetical protein